MDHLLCTMNFLAHTFLAHDSDLGVLGNLMGDFVKGSVAAADLHPELARGVRLHRAIDQYTDSHPEVRAAARRLSKPRYRFAGIILDVAFDHYLVHHWERFTDEAFDPFVDRQYRRLSETSHLAPATMQPVLDRMVTHDWFRGYRSIQGVGYALDRIARRFSRPVALPGAIVELEAGYTDFESHFLAFFPDLQAFVRDYEDAPAASGHQH